MGKYNIIMPSAKLTLRLMTFRAVQLSYLYLDITLSYMYLHITLSYLYLHLTPPPHWTETCWSVGETQGVRMLLHGLQAP